jgi:hypothetical protein
LLIFTAKKEIMRLRVYSLLLLGFCLSNLTETKAQFTIFAGPQISSAKYSIRGVKQSTEYKQGLMAGVEFKTLFEGPLYFAPSLSFTRKGYKVKFDRPAFPPDSAALNNNVSLSTIELAPLFQINFSKKATYTFIRFGPAFDFNLSGKEEFDTTGNKRVSRNMVFSFGDYSYATISLNAQIGYQHESGFTVFAQYVYGISSLNNADLGPQIFHRAAGIAIGWTLGKKR